MHGQPDSALCCRSLCSSTPFVHSKLNTCTSTQRNILGVSPPGSPLHHLLSSVTSRRNTAPTPHTLDKKRHLLLFPLQLEVERTGTGRPTPCMITGRSSLTGHKTLSLLSTLYLAVFTMGERFHSRPACIGPSVLASDMSRLMEETLDVEKQGADYIHLDVMDGHFVPNLTFGAPVIKGLRKHTKALLDAHLMVSHPAQWVDDMAAAGVDRFTFHVEATDKVSELIEAVKAKGMGVGLALKPGTPVEDVFPYCKELDLVLVMTVEPGFGGQSFMSDQMSKVKELRRRYPDLDIEVDGGLADNTIEEAATAGANLIVCGSYIFKGNKAERINLLKKAVEKYGNGKADKDLTPCVVVESGEKRPKTLAA